MKAERDSPLAPPRNEPTDASPLAIGAVAGTLALLIAISLGVSLPMVRGRGPVEGRESLFQNGASDRTSIEAAWAAAAGVAAPASYAWADRRRGLVRIPISRAVDLVCGDGGAPRGRDSR